MRTPAQMSGAWLTKGGVGSGNSPGLSEATDVEGVTAREVPVLVPQAAKTSAARRAPDAREVNQAFFAMQTPPTGNRSQNSVGTAPA